MYQAGLKISRDKMYACAYKELLAHASFFALWDVEDGLLPRGLQEPLTVVDTILGGIQRQAYMKGST